MSRPFSHAEAVIGALLWLCLGMKGWVKVVVVLFGAAVVIGSAAVYVVAPVPGLLARAEDATLRGVGNADPQEFAEARSALEAVKERLNSPPAKALRVVPVLGANLAAVDKVADGAAASVDAAGEVAAGLARLEEEGMLRRGRVRMDAIKSLRDPLDAQVAALRSMSATVKEARGGWLLPPVWDRLEALRLRTEDALMTARRLQSAVTVAPEILGEEGRRRQLVLLLNNAELRGAGGVITGVGVVRARNGRLSLGGFTSVHNLREEPPRKVGAPEEFVRRYGRNQADTTLWLNTSFSPHVPHVAEVARRVYRRTAGDRTDGVLAVDPRGLQALVPSDARLEVSGHGTVAGSDIAAYVYSDAYQRFRDQEDRREAIIALGRAAFEEFLSGDIDRQRLIAIREAATAGHIRFVSPSIDDDTSILLGIDGDIRLEEGDFGLMVAAQNLGSGDEGTKLDYWVRRSVTVRCRIEVDRARRCGAAIKLRNEAPRGLTEYVAGRPYGLLRTYLEVLVPEHVRVTAVELGGEPVELLAEPYVGWMSLGVEMQVPRGQERELVIEFTAPMNEQGFRMALLPQPLAHDADLDFQLDLPPGWVVQAGMEDRQPTYRGPFDRPIVVEARRADRTGIAAAWESVLRFWREPLF